MTSTWKVIESKQRGVAILWNTAYYDNIHRRRRLGVDFDTVLSPVHTVAEIGDSRRFLRHIVAKIGD